ncbi:extracellular solute-binding protein [Lachnoclostridium sp. Marseille-P6806]|uniref:extracellular solute-binding protein n=1 Tax=Lachnoclostridium sp. Marseille-P6806 TaxID=2364793 RepID=UPI0010326EBE|nr:extracellular solute-binding protein [Lachnoclostridium sp. Marseille-P6806]
MKKRWLAAFMAAAVAAGLLSGCGASAGAPSGEGTEASGTGTEDAEAEDTGESGEAEASQTGAFSQNVLLQIPVYDRGIEGVPDVTDNYWTKWVQDNFGAPNNITVEYVPITRSDVLTSYSLLAAADDLPTLCLEYDYPKLTQWADDGYLQPIDLDMVKEIAPTYWQNMVDNGLDQFTDLGDDSYFLMGTRPYSNTTYTFCTFYRRDWLDAIGVKEYPFRWTDRKAAYQAIVDKGLAEHPAGGWQIAGAGVDQNYPYRSYPQDELTWATTGDYNIPALTTEAQRILLKRENEAYHLGYKDPEYNITSVEDAKAKFVNGEVFEFSAYVSSNMDWLISFYDNNPDADLDVLALDGLVEDDDPATGKMTNAYRPNNLFGMMVGFAHDASADEVKAALMYLEWMAQPENLFTFTWGIEGENFNYDENGNPVSVPDYSGEYTQGYNNSVDYWCVVQASKSLGSIEEDAAYIAPQGLPEDFTRDIIDYYYGQLKVYEAGYAQMDCLFSSAVDAETEYAATLASKYAEYRDRLTMCPPEEFDALYEELSQAYLDDGYQEVIDGRKEAYEAGNSTKLSK